MKLTKLLLSILFTVVVFNACTTVYDVNFQDEYEQEVALNNLVTDFDVWYVDYHRTTGNGDIPYLSRAFTISFLNGTLYANNNIADIGRTGNGFGIDVGTYNTFNGILETNHDLDGANDFEVTVLSNNEIRLYNYRENVNYYLIGYQINEFDYDKLFYENIEYFLQEYEAWEKTTTNGGVPNIFDAENYLAFTPENITTFYSSESAYNTPIDLIDWNYIGGYEVFDVTGYEDLKILSLSYDNGYIEEFELSILNDQTIELFSLNSETIYVFEGKGFIQYLKGAEIKKEAKDIVRNEGRKRTKVERKIKNRRNLK